MDDFLAGFVDLDESGGLELEHRPVAAVDAISSFVRTEFDHTTSFDDTDAIRLPNGRNRCDTRMSCTTGSPPRCVRRSRTRRGRRAVPSARRAATTPAPIAPHTVREPARRAAIDRPKGRSHPRSPARAPCRGRQGRRRRPPRARRRRRRRAHRAGHVVAQRQVVAHEVLEHRGDPAAPLDEIELA